MSKTSEQKNKQEQILMFSKGNMDITLIFIVVFLIAFGVIMIYSSSYYASYAMYKNHIEYFQKQLIWSFIGLAVMYIVSKFNYKFICRFYFLIYIGTLVLLTIVLKYGKIVNGARRWIDIGIGSFQPSEIAKLAVVIIMAVSLASTRKYLDQIKVFLMNLVIIVAPVSLIFIENKSTSFVVLIIGIAMMFVAMPDKRSMFLYIILPALVAVVGAVIVVISMLTKLKDFMPEYVIGRIESFMEGPFADPMGKGYQSVQSLYAIGSGGVFGKGLGNSMQKNGFIPEAHNDIIFSIICEELGLFGAIAVLLLFALLLWRCVVIASRAKDLLGMLITTGVMTQIAIQVIINIAVVTNSMPVTGMPLPFISYGGSSLVFLLFEMGLVLSVSKQYA